jgi:hypothetical protein
MAEVMKDLENKLVLSLLEVFGAMAQKDDVTVMRVYLDLLSKLGHAKQCVPTPGKKSAITRYVPSQSFNLPLILDRSIWTCHSPE